MSKIKEHYHDKIEKEMKENNSCVFVDNKIIDFMPNETFWNIQDDSYDNAIKKIKELNPEFNENLHTFAYEFICRVHITPITKSNNAESSSTIMSCNKS